MQVEDYKQQQLAEEGQFKAFPVAWTIEKAESGAVAVAISFSIKHKWDPVAKAWTQEWPAGYYSDNRSWIIKRGGEELNQNAVDNLHKCGLWDGDFDKFKQPPPPQVCLIDVQLEKNEGYKDRYRVAWINPDADAPQVRGQFRPADPEMLDSLRSRFQSSTRAIAGGNSSGAPPAPPAAAPPASPGVAAPQASPSQAAPPPPPAAPPGGPTGTPTGEGEDPGLGDIETPF